MGRFAPNSLDLDGKVILVTGGTGSFGKTILAELLEAGVGEVRVLSRDEEKQDALRTDLRDPRVRFYVGDIRDRTSVDRAMQGATAVFHAAALKQVPSCEFFPLEAVKTNVMGTDNVLTAAIDEGVKTVICLSTDKAAYPVNAMGTFAPSCPQNLYSAVPPPLTDTHCRDIPRIDPPDALLTTYWPKLANVSAGALR